MPAGAWLHHLKNHQFATALATTKRWAYTSVGSATVRRMATGAMIGGMYGAVDNLYGDKVSIMGGAMRGAVLGGLYSGIRAGRGFKGSKGTLGMGNTDFRGRARSLYGRGRYSGWQSARRPGVF